MRKNKVFIFSKKLSILSQIQKDVLSLGHFDFSYFLQDELPSDVEQDFSALQEGKNIIICKNAQIDSLLEKLMLKNDCASLIFEQAVKLESDDRSLLFLPTELDSKKFLEEFLGQKSSFSSSIFGKTALQLEEKLEEIRLENSDFRYYIITKSPLSHTIISNFSVEDELSDFVFKPIDKNLEIAVADSFTYGAVATKLGECVKKCFVISGEEDFSNLGVQNVQSKENAYDIAKKMLEFSDLAVVILGGVFVAVGNRERIVVSSANLENREDVCDFALFKLEKFLNEEENNSKENQSKDID